MENELLVQAGLLQTGNDAHEWSSGVSFKSRHLVEPNTDLWKK